MDEFWTLALGRLKAMDRSVSWLSRRIDIKRSALHNYVHGIRPTPMQVRRDVAVLLSIRPEASEEAAA